VALHFCPAGRCTFRPAFTLKLSCAVAALGVAGLVAAASPDGDYGMVGGRVENLGNHTVHAERMRGPLTLAGSQVTGMDKLGDDTF